MENVALNAGLRAAWVLAGAAAVILHLPLTPVITLALAVPWLGVMGLLVRPATAGRLVRSWREAASTGGGAAALGTLVLVVFGVALAVALSAAFLLALWLVAGAAVVGVTRGAITLRQQLAGWALLTVSVGIAGLMAEGVLRLEPVAARLGTPAEIARWNDRYDWLWERNVLGIRSPYETLRKEPGLLRVVAIGDSFTWGDKIARSDSTWPAQLEADLRRRMPEPPLEVVNLGRNGFTTVNGAEMLRRLGWQFDPDLVIVQFHLNDILPSGPDFTREYSQWLFPRPWVVPQRYRTGPLGRSALLDLVEGALSAIRHGDDAARTAAWTALYQGRGPEWRALADALAEMGRAAAERDVPIVLMLFPELLPDLADRVEPPFEAIHDQVARTAEEAGFGILDLTPVFVREGGDLRRWWAAPYDRHPNEAAAGLAARALADHLLAMPDVQSRVP
jgi:lysophospholipase L1-like esterase